ncbi:fructose-6-phosphate aldolase [Breznakia pachnodae]|uniref:Fructose-6-phosphate aldolase 2 n=1 Tax=Breznakia pachnodae TaxID=265178 RepID=A0ABU0E794_9FIRM|nr:fructose-6-phosphate aldolase [Breznakia pachnodae]MDQ0362740.1 fructose-6-phosphate aldolase 2 [Breznakia pachnodae]
MKLLIDNANIEEIKRVYEFYPIDGVTCNPTILLKEGKNPYKLLKEIREFIGEEAQLHVQVISSEAEGMIEEGHKIQEILGKNTYIKIPVIPEGLKAIKHLASEGANVTGTAIYNQMQGYLAGKAGAKYVAPYVNRIDNLGYNGIVVTKQIHDMLKKANLETEVIAASFKNSHQVLELCEYGVGVSTVAPDVIEGFIKSDTITTAVDVFVNDFEKLCGENATMLTCIE